MGLFVRRQIIGVVDQNLIGQTNWVVAVCHLGQAEGEGLGLDIGVLNIACLLGSVLGEVGWEGSCYFCASSQGLSVACDINDFDGVVCHIQVGPGLSLGAIWNEDGLNYGCPFLEFDGHIWVSSRTEV